MLHTVLFAILLQYGVTVFCLTVTVVEKRLLSGATILDEPSAWKNVSVNGQTHIFKGMVGVGQFQANATDSHGDTIGAFGSGIAIIPGSFKKNLDGSFSCALATVEDRGQNINGTVPFQHRLYNIEFNLKPYFGLQALSFQDALETIQLKVLDTVFDFEKFGDPTTALDANAVRPATFGFPLFPGSEPELPIPQSVNRLTMDVEGIVVFENVFGNNEIYYSEEYGPYIYQVTPEGVIMKAIVPPDATLPSTNGILNFTSESDPTCGRMSNTGLEGLTASHDKKSLYALLQGATAQDGGSKKATSHNTRLYQYALDTLDIIPPLVGEFIVPLPTIPDNKTKQSSELHFLNDNTFLVLSRDGDGFGNGGDPTLSTYKGIDIAFIAGATNIAHTKFDECEFPVAPKGVLDPTVTPAEYISFISLLDGDQLGRFGMNNQSNGPNGIIDKFESLAIFPLEDPQNPEDYIIITCDDNDFQTTDGHLNGQPFNAGFDIPNQCMAFLATLPSIDRSSLESFLGIPSL